MSTDVRLASLSVVHCRQGNSLRAHWMAEKRDLVDLARRAARGSTRAAAKVTDQRSRIDEASRHYLEHLSGCSDCTERG